MITEEKIKQDMMELWKETFHDSRRYIEIVFDSYFTPDSVIVRYHENILIASLLSVAYEFQIVAKGGVKRTQRGLYLCGLATRSEYRRQGIMSEMMREAESKAKENGYDFTFLIPADTHLREYYRSNGYVDSSFRTTVRIEEGKGLEYEPLHIYSIKDLFKMGNIRMVEYLADWCREREKENRNPTIIHSRKDMIAVMAENENSIFMTEDRIDLENPILENVIAVAFPELSNEVNEVEKVVLAGLYVKNKHGCESGCLKDEKNISSRVNFAICKYYSGCIVEMRKPYVHPQIDVKGVVPYAMIKSLDANENSAKIENTRYKIFLMLD